MFVRSRLYTCPALISGILLLCGCASPSHTNKDTGRVSTTDTTQAEIRSGKVSITALNEFVDEAVGLFIQDVSSIPEVQEYRGSIIIGSIANNTRSVSTSDFESIMTNFRSSLVRNRVASNNVRFISSRAQWESTRRREGLLNEEDDDLLQTGDRQRSGRNLNTDYVFFLNGEFSRIKRGNVSQYQLVLTLTEFHEGAYVWSSEPFRSKEFGG